jgi:hypothetical protein
MGCQVELARHIIDQGGNYLLSVKENQSSLSADCTELFAWLHGPHPLDEPIVLGMDAQVGGGQASSRWWSLVMVEATRHIGRRGEVEQRYDISSLMRNDSMA